MANIEEDEVNLLPAADEGAAAAAAPRQDAEQRERARAAITFLGWYVVRCWVKVHRNILHYHVALGLSLSFVLYITRDLSCPYVGNWAQVYLAFIPIFLVSQALTAFQEAAISSRSDMALARPKAVRLLFIWNRLLNVFQIAWFFVQITRLARASGRMEGDPVPPDESCYNTNRLLYSLVFVALLAHITYALILMLLLFSGTVLSAWFLHVIGMFNGDLQAMREANASAAVGLTAEAIEGATATREHDSAASAIPEDDRVCVICLEQYADGEALRVLGCRHHFHAACIDEWLSVSRLCPFCKGDVVEMGPQPTGAGESCREEDLAAAAVVAEEPLPDAASSV